MTNKLINIKLTLSNNEAESYSSDKEFLEHVEIDIEQFFQHLKNQYGQRVKIEFKK